MSERRKRGSKVGDDTSGGRRPAATPSLVEKLIDNPLYEFVRYRNTAFDANGDEARDYFRSDWNERKPGSEKGVRTEIKWVHRGATLAVSFSEFLWYWIKRKEK